MEQFRIQDSTPIYSLTFYVLLLGKLIEHNISTGAYKKYYLFNGKLIALREGLGSTSTRRYLLTDHLGSLNTTLNLDGTVYSDLRYTPFGKERWAINTSPTGARFTAQRLDDLLSLYNYNARYYDPEIGRFISADTLVPGPKRQTPLTVDFHETVFLNEVNKENHQLMAFGALATWSQELKQKLGIVTGPFNPQVLNRFTYTLNSPLCYLDPSGHDPDPILPDIIVNIEPLYGSDGWWLFTFRFGNQFLEMWIHESDPIFTELRLSVNELNGYINEFHDTIEDNELSEDATKWGGYLGLASLIVGVLGIIAGGVAGITFLAIAGLVLTVVGIVVTVLYGLKGIDQQALDDMVAYANSTIYGDASGFISDDPNWPYHPPGSGLLDILNGMITSYQGETNTLIIRGGSGW